MCLKKTFGYNLVMLESILECYKNHQMCGKDFDNYYLHALKLVPNCYKTCDKAVNKHPFTVQFVPECKMTQEMCDKGVNRCFLVFYIIPDWYRT